MADETEPGTVRYPEAPRGSVVDELHGHRIPDPYRWLEDAESANTLAWQAAQDALFQAHRATWSRRTAFAERVRALFATGTVSRPVWRGDRSFMLRRLPDQELAVLYVVENGVERTLIDPLQLNPDGTTTLDGWFPSLEGNLLAYRISHGGTEESDLYVMDVTSGTVIEGPIDRTRSSAVAWLPEEKAFFYVRRLPPEEVPDGETQYHRRVWLHRVGTDPSEDVVVFGDGMDKTTFFRVGTSRDGRYLFVSATLGTAPRNDLWLADLSASALEAPEFVPIQVGVDAKVAASVGRDGRLYLWTDRDAARGRICVTDPATPGAEHWRTLVPERSDAVLTGYAVLDGPELERPELLVSWTRHSVGEITVHDLATGRQTGEVPLPGLGTISGLSARPEGGHECWFGYTDFGTPAGVWRYDARRRTCELWARCPGEVELPDVTVRQVAYTSADGTTVRMFLLTGPDTAGPRPAVLSGYGGFGVSTRPTYLPRALAWVEAGGVYAIPALRGGGDEGEAWHRAGTRERKHKVYEDFEAAADWLVEQGWTTPDRLVITGGSNGGLLVGAALTRRPHAYRAVICSAPLLDMVRYELSGLGRLWTDEFGTVEKPEELEWLLSYSPYHHVRPGTAYPAVLFTVFDGDSRTDPLHARKMTAALQHATTADPETAPILLRREAQVGHGTRSVSRTVGLTADTLAFAAWACGL